MDPNPSLQNECSDRISNLPDPILGLILSHLNVKDVIATSILSTRCKTLFPNSVPLTELVLDDSHKSHKENSSNSSSRSFVDFVDKLLNVTLRDVPCVEKVVLNCEKDYDEDKIVSWVCAALRLNVKHLRVIANLTDSEALFDTLDGCTTLVELELGNEYVTRVPEDFTLPNLKKLTFYTYTLLDDVNELLDGCPVLKEVSIMGCDLSGMNTLYIKNPVLSKLSIEGCFYESGCKIVIDAPKLEIFVYDGHFVANYVLKNTKCLHSVCIDFDSFAETSSGSEFRSRARPLAKLLKACSTTTRLCLGGNSVKALYSPSAPLPTFQNLTCLALGHMGNRGWRMLAQFLKSAPNLTMLNFQEGLGSARKGAYAGFQSSLPSLPVCLELHVKKIDICEFGCRPDEIKLIEYFLKNAKVLQELMVHCLPHVNTSNLKKLAMLPTHSKACQVLLVDEDNWAKSRYSRDSWF